MLILAGIILTIMGIVVMASSRNNILYALGCLTIVIAMFCVFLGGYNQGLEAAYNFK